MRKRLRLCCIFHDEFDNYFLHFEKEYTKFGTLWCPTALLSYSHKLSSHIRTEISTFSYDESFKFKSVCQNVFKESCVCFGWQYRSYDWNRNLNSCQWFSHRIINSNTFTKQNRSWINNLMLKYGRLLSSLPKS